MILKNKLTKLIILTAILLILELIVILDGQLYIGKLINYTFPCKQSEANSFPCYGIYSIYLFFGLLVSIFGLIGYILELKISENNTSKSLGHKIINIVGYAILAGLITLICWIIFGKLFLK